jgi:predicted PurR-regulated permease PerM
MPRGRETESERISNLIFYGTVLLLGWLAYRIVEPFLVEIGWALVLAITLQPVRDRLVPRFGPTRPALLLTLVVLVLLALPLTFAGFALLNEGQQVVAHLKDELENKGGGGAWLHSAYEWVHARLPFLPSEDEAIAQITERLGGVAGYMAARAGGLLAGVAALAFKLVIMLGMLFFLLRDSDSFAAGFLHVLPFQAEQNERLVALTRRLVSASVTAVLIGSCIQGIIGGITFALLGIPGAPVWGLVMSILAFLPVVGATLVWLPTSVWLLLSGSVVKGLILLAVGVGILGNVENVVRPLLISGHTKMNTLVLLVSLLGGIGAFGFIGVVLGPLVAAIITALFESYLVPPPGVEAAAPSAAVPPPAPPPPSASARPAG